MTYTEELKRHKPMKFLDLFSGIGGFRLGLEMAGHECVGHIEIDKFANQSYQAIHQPKESEFFHEDITTITDESIRELRDRGIDIITGGFPCQAFSIAGKRAGFEDTRGTLFFDIAKIAKEIKPKYLFLENVKGLLSSKTPLPFYYVIELLNHEIVGGTLWEEKFSPMSNWNMLSDNISHYLAEKLQMNLVYQNLKLDTSSRKNLKLVYEMTEQEVELGLMKRLKYLETQISQITKKQNNCQTELTELLGDKEEGWVLIQRKLYSIESLKTMDMSTLEKTVVINGEIEKLLNKKSEENSNHTKLYTTSTESKQTIDQKICMFVQEQNILLFIIKQWKSSTNLWKKVMSNLMKEKEGMYYVGTFNIILNTLDELGYDAEWQVLNSKHYVPQNRERVYIIGNLRGAGGRKVFPFGEIGREITTEPREKAKEIKVVGRVGNGIHDSNRVIDSTGIAQTMQARDYKDPIKVMVKEATKQGYAIAVPGDSINLKQPNSKTRRGRVGKGVANTLTTSCNQGVIIDKMGEEYGQKKRNTVEVLRKLQQEIGAKKVAEWRLRIFDSLQQEKILRSEVHGGSLHEERKDTKPKLVRCARKGEGDEKFGILRIVRSGGECGYSSHRRGLAEQFGGELASVMSKLPHEGAQKEGALQNLRRTTEGIELLQQTLLEVQKIWRPELFEGGFRIRKLTPRETWRLQGFPDWAFDRAKAAGVSDSQLYKQAGNSVTVNVVYEIAKRLK